MFCFHDNITPILPRFVFAQSAPGRKQKIEVLIKRLES